MIYVIADDLTGANDTGVQLSKRGYNTLVYIASISGKLDINNCNEYDVIVVDTETRDLQLEDAKKRLTSVLSAINIKKGKQIIYKKVDSTLRGNIGAEIDIIMDSMNIDICILAPTLPSNSRYVVGGYLLVKNEPLGTSQYYNGILGAGDASFIPYLLREQTKISIGRIELKDVIKGKECISAKIKENYIKGNRIIVVDALKEQHLKSIIAGSNTFKGSVLYAGSAGLANYLSKSKVNKKTTINNDSGESKEATLMVIGSRNSVMNDQVDYFKSRVDSYDLKINLEKMLGNKTEAFNEYLEEALVVLEDKPRLIIRPDPIFNTEKVIEGLMVKSKLNFRELEVIIREFLGQLSKHVVRKSSLKNVIVTGGDTATGFCYSLGIQTLYIIDEILPGVPLAIEKDSQKNNHLKIVTKAGGFGNRDTLYRIYEKLTKY